MSYGLTFGPKAVIIAILNEIELYKELLMFKYYFYVAAGLTFTILVSL